MLGCVIVLVNKGPNGGSYKLIINNPLICLPFHINEKNGTADVAGKGGLDVFLTDVAIQSLAALVRTRAPFPGASELPISRCIHSGAESLMGVDYRGAKSCIYNRPFCNDARKGPVAPLWRRRLEGGRCLYKEHI